MPTSEQAPTLEGPPGGTAPTDTELRGLAGRLRGEGREQDALSVERALWALEILEDEAAALTQRADGERLRREMGIIADWCESHGKAIEPVNEPVERVRQQRDWAFTVIRLMAGRARLATEGEEP